MRITIDLDTDDAADLAGLTALIAALGGGQAKGEPLVIKYRTDVPAVPPPPAPEVPESERLLQALADSRQPAASAPSGGADDETPNANAPATDSRGYPWDERIHASTKAVNGDGTWRNKRGVNKDLLAEVETEMAANAVPGPPADEPLAGDLEVFDAATLERLRNEHTAALGTPGATVPPPPPAPAVPPPPPAPAAPPAAGADTPTAESSITYPQIIKLAGEKKNPDGSDFTYEQLNGIAGTLGLPAFKNLVKRPDLFESFVAALG